MIARIWHGTTRLADAESYLEYLNHFVIPGYQAAEGNRGVFIMTEYQGELACFLLLTFWVSEDALKKYIGIPGDVVNPNPDEKNLLVAFESTARHYKVIESLEEGGQYVH